MLNLGQTLVIFGIIIILIGIFLMSGANIPFLGRLPGDVKIEKPGFSFYFPLTSSILISVALSLIFWIIGKFLNK